MNENTIYGQDFDPPSKELLKVLNYFSLSYEKDIDWAIYYYIDTELHNDNFTRYCDDSFLVKRKDKNEYALLYIFKNKGCPVSYSSASKFIQADGTVFLKTQIMADFIKSSSHDRKSPTREMFNHFLNEWIKLEKNLIMAALI